MKKNILKFCLAMCAITISVAFAQPTTLDELLAKVKAGALIESKEYQEREREFKQAKDNQQALLSEAKRKRDAEEKISEELEASFNAQEEELARVDKLLKEKMGSLRELFGVLQQVSVDLRGKFETSNISAQFPNRGEPLEALGKKMGVATELPTIDELRNIIFQLQLEMTESGRVARFTTDVVEPDGDKVAKEVIRVGGFNLMADGKYLYYDDGNLLELDRQPSGHFVATISDLENATSGYVPVALDPSSGSVLSALVQVASWGERWRDEGGTVGWVIMIGGLIGLLLAIWRFLVVGGIRRRVHAQIANSTPSDDNPLGRVLAVYHRNKSVDTETLELKLSEAILKETPDIVKMIGLLKIVAVVAPLLGLLGTVTGMILTFQAITLFGAGDPKLMAGGISQALITTMQGLCVAIPMTLLHSIVNSSAKGVIHILEEQSAGIIAAHNEQRNR